MPLSADDFLASELSLDTSPNIRTGSGIFGATQAERTNKKDYRAAYIYVNVTSYSQRNDSLHDCPRKYQISKQPAISSGFDITNVDFIFGHSVGAGIQAYLATSNRDVALFASFLAWNTDLDYETEFSKKKGKSSWLAFIAVEKFIYWWDLEMAHDWEIATFNGRPASELTFFLDCENGFYHAGHIDIILRNKKTGRYLVLEIKTTAIRNVDEAQYGNSEQPLGYSLILDTIVKDLNATNSFEVLYLVYSSTLRSLVPLHFTKNRSERVEWLQDLLLDHSTISTYRKLGYFPKRGKACWTFSSRCAFYGMCDLAAYKRSDNFKVFDRSTMDLPEKVDFEFTLGDITRALLMDKVVVDRTASASAT